MNFWVIGLCFDCNVDGSWCSGVGWIINSFEVYEAQGVFISPRMIWDECGTGVVEEAHNCPVQYPESPLSKEMESWSQAGTTP